MESQAHPYRTLGIGSFGHFPLAPRTLSPGVFTPLCASHVPAVNPFRSLGIWFTSYPDNSGFIALLGNSAGDSPTSLCPRPPIKWGLHGDIRTALQAYRGWVISLDQVFKLFSLQKLSVGGWEPLCLSQICFFKFMTYRSFLDSHCSSDSRFLPCSVDTLSTHLISHVHRQRSTHASFGTHVKLLLWRIHWPI